MPSLRLRTRHSVTTRQWWDGKRPIEVWWERIQHATFDIQVLSFSHHKSFCERPRETIEIVWGILWNLLEAGCFRHSAFIRLDFWISLDECRLHRQGFKQANPFNYSPVNLLECPPVGKLTSLGSTLKMGFHSFHPESNFVPLPEISSSMAKLPKQIHLLRSSTHDLQRRFILITHVPLFVTPSVAVTHPIVIHWYMCLSTGTNRGEEITISHTLGALPKTQTTDDNGAWHTIGAPSIKVPGVKSLGEVWLVIGIPVSWVSGGSTLSLPTGWPRNPSINY